MAREFIAIIEKGDDGYFLATAPEVPSACGQGLSIEEAKEDLASSIEFVFEFHRDEALAQLAAGAIQDVVQVA